METQFPANTLCTTCGKIWKNSAHREMLNPMPSEKAAIVSLRLVKPQSESILIPTIRIVPKIISEHPPITGWGIVAKIRPKTGKMPIRIMITAPVPIVNLFTTLVIATIPIFSLKEVIGVQPKSEPNELIKPSTAREPEISLGVTCRLSPISETADVSPIVSVADTR